MNGKKVPVITCHTTNEIERLLGAADTSQPGLWVLYAEEGKICLNRREFVPPKVHRIIFLSGADINNGLTVKQWSKIHNKIILLLLNKGLKL